MITLSFQAKETASSIKEPLGKSYSFCKLPLDVNSIMNKEAQ